MKRYSSFLLALVCALCTLPLRADSDLTLDDLFRDKPLTGKSARSAEWSHDDRYLGYLWNGYDDHGMDLWVYDTRTKKSSRVTTIEMMAAFDRTAPVESSAAALTPAASRLSLVSSELGAGTESLVERARGSRALDVTGGRDITSAFGDRRDPFTGATRFHRGVDLRAAYGQDVATAAGGTVAFSGTQGGYGTTVVVEHANGTRTRFAHLSVALVAPGQAVEPGQVVGRAGSSGRATGAHLHLEVTDRDRQPLNPLIHPDSHR